MKPINVSAAEAFRYYRGSITDDEIQEELDKFECLCEILTELMPDFDPNQPEDLKSHLPGLEWSREFPDYTVEEVQEELCNLRDFCYEINKAVVYNHAHGISYYDSSTGLIVAEELRMDK